MLRVLKLLFTFRGTTCALPFFEIDIFLCVPSYLFFVAEHCIFTLFQELGTTNFVKHDGIDPGPFLASPHLLCREPHTAGRQRVFSWLASLLSSSHTWEARMWSTEGTRAVCSRLSSPVPGPHRGRGHTCRIPPWACSVSLKSDETRAQVRYSQKLALSRRSCKHSFARC